MNDLKSLKQLFEERIFRIPSYQRGYSWGDDQLVEFWDDLLSMLPGKSHYTGMISLKTAVTNETIVNFPEDKWVEERWLVNSGYRVEEVVDGQQRLTTLVILINEIVKYCQTHHKEEICDVKLNKVIETYLYQEKSNIIKTYMFGYATDNPSYRYFRAHILEQPDAGEAEETFYTLNLKNAKDFFRKRIAELGEKDFAEVETIFRKVTLFLKFNLYNIQDDFNVYVAFETMNNRGKPLSNLELMKNRLIYLTTLFKDNEDGGVKIQAQKNIDETWKEVYKYLGMNPKKPLKDDEFLQHHWIIYFGYNTRKDEQNKTIPFNEFLLKKYFVQQNIRELNLPTISYVSNADADDDDDEEDEATVTANTGRYDLTLQAINEYVLSLRQLIPYWYQTHTPTNVKNPELAKYIFRLNALGYVNARPLATVVLWDTNSSEEEKVACFKQIERFNFLTYRLAGYFSTYNNSVFYNYARDLYAGKITVEDITQALGVVDCLSENNVVCSKEPEMRFEKLRRYDGFYSWKAIKYFLYIYDLSLTQTEAERQIDPDDYFSVDQRDSFSVEHIFPQKGTDAYWTKRFGRLTEQKRKILNGSLGNLLPLSRRINSSLQNYAFTTKTERYLKGSKSEELVARYPDGINLQTEWTPDFILERGMKMLNFMEEEFEFKFPNDMYRKTLLGLDFMADEDDEMNNRTEIIPRKAEPRETEQVFSEDDLQRLLAASSDEIKQIFQEIHQYCLSLADNVTAYTTRHYISYKTTQSFLDIHFHQNDLRLNLRPIDYDDPEHRTAKMDERYNWARNITLELKSSADIEYAKKIIQQSFDSLNR